MKSPGGIEPAGAYTANSAVSLVPVPVEPVDQRGGDRLDIRFQIFAADLNSRKGRNASDGKCSAVKAGESIFAAQEQSAW